MSSSRTVRKAERRRRIMEAAREIFRDRGYAGGTMRAIAERAGVGTGTLFLYARDKRDLLLMIFNDDLDAITERSSALVDSNADLTTQLLVEHRPRYVYWHADPKLALQALQEALLIDATALDADTETARFYRRLMAQRNSIEETVRREQARGRIDADVDARAIAWMLVTLYTAEIRLALAERLTVDEGIGRLERSMRIALRGITVGA